MSSSTLDQWRDKANQLEAELMKVKEDYNLFREVQEDIEKDQAAQIDEKARELKKVRTENQQYNAEFMKIKERAKRFQFQYQQSEKEKLKLSQSIRRNDGQLNDYKNQVVQLQIDNDELRNQLRNERGRNTHLEQTLDTMLEENGLLKTELEDTKNQAKEQIQRLKQQLDEASMEVEMKERQIKKIRLPGQDTFSPSQAGANNNNSTNIRNQLMNSNLAASTDLQMRSPHRRATVYTYSRYSARSSLTGDYFNTTNGSGQFPHQSSLQNQQLQTSFGQGDQIHNSSGISRNGRKSLSGEQQSGQCVVVGGLQTPVNMPILEGDAKDEASPQKLSDHESSNNYSEKRGGIIFKNQSKIKLNKIPGSNNNNNLNQIDLQRDDIVDSENSFQDENIFEHNRGTTLMQNSNTATLRPRRMTGKKLSDLFDMESQKINMDKLFEIDLEQDSFMMPSQYALNMVTDLVSEMDSHLLSLNQKKGDIAHFRYQDEIRFPGDRMAVIG